MIELVLSSFSSKIWMSSNIFQSPSASDSVKKLNKMTSSNSKPLTSYTDKQSECLSSTGRFFFVS